MDKQEIFKVFDACQPTVAQVKEYLERISGNSPFDLIFVKEDGSETITRHIRKDLGKLIGIVMGRTIFYAEGLGRKEGNELSQDKQITVADVFAFGKKFHPRAKPMNQDALDILNNNSQKYSTLLDMLSVFGYEALPLQRFYMTFEATSDKTFAEEYELSGFADGSADIKYFIYNNNIFFCCSMK